MNKQLIEAKLLFWRLNTEVALLEAKISVLRQTVPLFCDNGLLNAMGQLGHYANEVNKIIGELGREVEKESQKMITKDRIINTLSWMVEHFKWAHGQTGIGGDFSPELREAMNLLDELKQEDTALLSGTLT